MEGIKNVYYAGESPNRESVTYQASYMDIMKCIRLLDRNGVQPFYHNANNTRPIVKSYVAIGHTDLQYDFSEIDEFKPLYEYRMGGTFHVLERGMVGFGKLPVVVRIILTPYAEVAEKSGANGYSMLSGFETPKIESRYDVYPVYIFGVEGIGIIEENDGWSTLKTKVINPSNVVQYECACTAL